MIMFHKAILYISWCKCLQYYIFFISNMRCYKLHLDNFKGDFLNLLIICLPDL